MYSRGELIPHTNPEVKGKQPIDELLYVGDYPLELVLLPRMYGLFPLTNSGQFDGANPRVGGKKPTVEYIADYFFLCAPIQPSKTDRVCITEDNDFRMSRIRRNYVAFGPDEYYIEQKGQREVALSHQHIRLPGPRHFSRRGDTIECPQHVGLTLRVVDKPDEGWQTSLPFVAWDTPHQTIDAHWERPVFLNSLHAPVYSRLTFTLIRPGEKYEFVHWRVDVQQKDPQQDSTISVSYGPQDANRRMLPGANSFIVNFQGEVTNKG